MRASTCVDVRATLLTRCPQSCATYTYARAVTHTRTYKHAHTHAHAHTRTHAHTHTHIDISFHHLRVIMQRLLSSEKDYDDNLSIYTTYSHSTHLVLKLNVHYKRRITARDVGIAVDTALIIASSASIYDFQLYLHAMYERDLLEHQSDSFRKQFIEGHIQSYLSDYCHKQKKFKDSTAWAEIREQQIHKEKVRKKKNQQKKSSQG